MDHRRAARRLRALIVPYLAVACLVAGTLVAVAAGSAHPLVLAMVLWLAMSVVMITVAVSGRAGDVGSPDAGATDQ